MLSKKHISGFTLLELTVVLTIIGIIVASGLAVFTSSLQAAQFNKTVQRMDRIESVLASYAAVYNRIPCPSDLTLPPANANYGVEAANKGACTGGTPAANSVAASLTVEGGVPTRALQLTDDYLYDGWGRRMRYSVDPLMTVTGSLPATAQCRLSSAPNPSAITVADAAGAARSSKSIYALLSMGANGHGGYTSAGIPATAGSVNANELTNCHCNSSAAATAYTPSYVQTVPTLDPANRQNSYDDIVTYKEGWQLQTPNYPLNANSCNYFLYVIDSGNTRVEKFDSAGNYISQFGNAYLGNPAAIAVDASGNSYVTDILNNKVDIFNNAGVITSQFGSSTNRTAAGNFDRPYGIALDGSGNIYIADMGNSRIDKFSGSGSYLAQFGIAGSGSGQLNAPRGVAIDASGNIWVSDTGNNRIQEFNASGSYLMQFGSTGSGNGQFNSPQALTFDASGNLWVTDTGNSRIQKFTGSGVYMNQAGSNTTTGQNGKFNTALGIAADPAGNIYVSDGSSTADNRVEMLNSAGIYQNQTGFQGSGNGAFLGPAGVAIGSQ